jgi:hypothetical protein
MLMWFHYGDTLLLVAKYCDGVKAARGARRLANKVVVWQLRGDSHDGSGAGKGWYNFLRRNFP